jgi:hypothetical protein
LFEIPKTLNEAFGDLKYLFPRNIGTPRQRRTRSLSPSVRGIKVEVTRLEFLYDQVEKFVEWIYSIFKKPKSEKIDKERIKENG